MNKIQYTTNPLTGRPVAIGSTVYKKLVHQGYIQDDSMQAAAPTPRRAPQPVRRPPRRPQAPRKVDFDDEEEYVSDGESNLDVNALAHITSKTIKPFEEKFGKNYEPDDEMVSEISSIIQREYNKLKNKKN